MHSDKLDTYLATPFTSDDKITKFWNEQKLTSNLYKLHQKHHIVPATSSATERAFSCAGLILSDRRNRLNDEIFQQMLVANLNADLMY